MEKLRSTIVVLPGHLIVAESRASALSALLPDDLMLCVCGPSLAPRARGASTLVADRGYPES